MLVDKEGKKVEKCCEECNYFRPFLQDELGGIGGICGKGHGAVRHVGGGLPLGFVKFYTTACKDFNSRKKIERPRLEHRIRGAEREGNYNNIAVILQFVTKQLFELEQWGTGIAVLDPLAINVFEEEVTPALEKLITATERFAKLSAFNEDGKDTEAHNAGAGYTGWYTRWRTIK